MVNNESANDEANLGLPAVFVLDRRGVPTSRDAYRLIEWLFSHRDRFANLEEISRALQLPAERVEGMCHQLRLLDIIFEEPPKSRQYRYHLNCKDVELQAAVEMALVDYPTQAGSEPPSIPRLPELPDASSWF